MLQDIHDELNFQSRGGDRVFGLWSLRFSSDGREIVAGSNDASLYVYDLEANKQVGGGVWCFFYHSDGDDIYSSGCEGK